MWLLSRAKRKASCIYKTTILSSDFRNFVPHKRVCLVCGLSWCSTHWKLLLLVAPPSFTGTKKGPSHFPKMTSLPQSSMQKRRHKAWLPLLKLFIIDYTRRDSPKKIGTYPCLIPDRRKFTDSYRTASGRMYNNKWCSPSALVLSLRAAFPWISSRELCPIFYHPCLYFSLFDIPLDFPCFLNPPYQMFPQIDNIYTLEDFLEYCLYQYLTHRKPIFVVIPQKESISKMAWFQKSKRDNLATTFLLSQELQFLLGENRRTRGVSPVPSQIIVFGAQFLPIKITCSKTGKMSKSDLQRAVKWLPATLGIPSSTTLPGWRLSKQSILHQLDALVQDAVLRPRESLETLSKEAKKALFSKQRGDQIRALVSQNSALEDVYGWTLFPDLKHLHLKKFPLSAYTHFSVPDVGVVVKPIIKQKRRLNKDSPFFCPICKIQGHGMSTPDCPLFVPRHEMATQYERKLYDFVLHTLHFTPTADAPFLPHFPSQADLLRLRQDRHKLAQSFWDTFRNFASLQQALSTRLCFGDIINSIHMWFAIGTPRMILLNFVAGFSINLSDWDGQRYFVQSKSLQHPSARAVLTSMTKEKQKLGQILRVPQHFGQFILNQFPVDFELSSLRRPRIIFDARVLNMFLPYVKFSLPTLPDVLAQLKAGSLMISIDLKSAYSQLTLTPAAMRKVCFRIPHGEDWQYFAYTGYPFGHALGPFVFQTVLSCLTKYLCRSGFGPCFQYLDDILIVIGNDGDSPAVLRARTEFILSLCHELGIILNPKSALMYTSLVEWLGFFFDLADTEVKAFPGRNKITRSLEIIELFLCAQEASIAQMESFVGLIQTLNKINNFIASLKGLAGSFIQQHLLGSHEWTERELLQKKQVMHVLPQEFLEANETFLEIVDRQGFQIATHDVPPEQTLTIGADVSDDTMGWFFSIGADLYIDEDLALYSAPLPQEAQSTSSSVREACGVYLALLQVQSCALHKKLPPFHAIRILGDNRATTAALRSGRARSQALAHIVMHINTVLDQIGVPVSAQWERRSTPNLQLADALSRVPSASWFNFSGALRRLFVLTSHHFWLPLPMHELHSEKKMAKAFQSNDRFQHSPVFLLPFFQTHCINSLVSRLQMASAFGIIILPCFVRSKGWKKVKSSPWHGFSLPNGCPLNKLGIFEYSRDRFASRLKSYQPRCFSFDFRPAHSSRRT